MVFINIKFKSRQKYILFDDTYRDGETLKELKND